MKEKFYVTTPIYYVNDKPHIGHIYTTIAADTLARWQRSKNKKVLFSTGTDENSQKNVEAAQAAGQEVKPYVDQAAQLWRDTFRQLNFSYDVFIRTTSACHREAVLAVIEKISAAGDIYLGDYEGYYCGGCESFVATNDLVDGLCPDHQQRPKRIKEKNYFFKLSRYRQALLAHYAKKRDFVQPDSARNKMIHYISKEMTDVSISRQAQKWGIRLPQDPSHAVYVWFDALINYLTVTGYPDLKKSHQWWPADIHLIGKDIIKFHGAIWPAMLLSAGLPLPEKIFAHGFFTIDGRKISKSLGNAINPLALAQQYPFDAIRYYLLREIPFGNDGGFSRDRLKKRYNADLANGLGNLVSRALNMLEKYWPDFEQSVGGAAVIEQKLVEAERRIEGLAFDQALALIWEVIAWADDLIEQTKPWELVKEGKGEEAKAVLSQLYEVLRAVSRSIAPFMPDTAVRLIRLLEARPIKKPTEPLFARKE